MRRRGPGAKSRIAPARSSTPSSISTTTPSTRRSAPQTFSTSSASCLPSTKIREPLATLARCPDTARDPLAVRADAARASARRASALARGGVRVTGAPSTRKPGPRRKPLVRPWRSSRCTTRMPPAFSTRTTAPTQPVSTSSTTVPCSAASSTERPLAGRRQSPPSTSSPYLSVTAVRLTRARGRGGWRAAGCDATTRPAAAAGRQGGPSGSPSTGHRGPSPRIGTQNARVPERSRDRSGDPPRQPEPRPEVTTA